jgi:hypothetical protein
MSVIAYDFAVVDVFALNLAERATVPVLHRTVAANPAIVGLDDHPQVFAFLTAAVKVTEPPDALTVFVAAPAWANTGPPRKRTTPAIQIASLCFIGTPKTVHIMTHAIGKTKAKRPCSA